MKETNRGYWNNVRPHPLTLGEILIWAFVFLFIFATVAAFAALCIFLSSLSAGKIPVKMGFQTEDHLKFVSSTGNKVLDKLRAQALTQQQLMVALAKGATKPVACKSGQPTQDLYMIINGQKVPVLKNAGIYAIVGKKNTQPGLCFQTNPDEYYQIRFDRISTTEQGFFTIHDLHSGVVFKVLYVNFGSWGVKYSDDGQLIGQVLEEIQ